MCFIWIMSCVDDDKVGDILEDIVENEIKAFE